MRRRAGEMNVGAAALILPTPSSDAMSDSANGGISP
jgi:hypothetical protein